MKRILFRADAKPSIGIGDLMSLITLSEYMDNFECFFLTQATSAAKNIMEKRVLKNVFWLQENTSIQEDVAAINRILDEYTIDVLFFEITERKLTEYKEVKSDIPKVCVNFDGFIPNDMKIVINWDAAARKYYDIDQFPKTKFLLGPKYVILPKAFYTDEIKHRQYSKLRKKILITMGGADELDFTSKVAHTVANEDRELIIIVGYGYAQKDKLKDSLNAKGIKHTIKVNVEDMLSEYLSCDFAIGAGGLTSSELVASRTPCALIATYEHQIARCEYFDQESWAKYLGFRSYNDNLLNITINEFYPQFDECIFDTKGLPDAVHKI